MSFSECAAFLRGMHRKEKTELERTRLVMWSVLQSQSRNALELDDIMNIDDDEAEDKERRDASDLSELRKRAKLFEG